MKSWDEGNFKCNHCLCDWEDWAEMELDYDYEENASLITSARPYDWNYCPNCGKSVKENT